MRQIVYVITQATWGGAQAHLYSLIKDQCRRGNQVTLVFGSPGLLITQLKERYPQVKLIRLASMKREISVAADFTTVIKLRRIFKKIKPQIVHLHSTKAGIVGRVSAVGCKCKVIFTVHGWAFTPGVGKAQQLVARFLEKLLRPITNLYICVSKFDYELGTNARVLKKKHDGVVIYNGVTRKEYAEIAASEKSTKFIITMAARFNPPKAQRLLIEALQQLNNPKIEIRFLGDGPLLNEAMTLARKLGLTNQVKFIGRVDDVQNYYKNSDVVALISYYEGLPVSLVEALAQGCPIIASDVGGNSELVQSNGLLVNNVPKEIARSIEQLKAAHNLNEMKLNSLNLYNQYFTEKSMVDKTEYCYDSLCHQN